MFLYCVKYTDLVSLARFPCGVDLKFLKGRVAQTLDSGDVLAGDPDPQTLYTYSKATGSTSNVFGVWANVPKDVFASFKVRHVFNFMYIYIYLFIYLFIYIYIYIYVCGLSFGAIQVIQC